LSMFSRETPNVCRDAITIVLALSISFWIRGEKLGRSAFQGCPLKTGSDSGHRGRLRKMARLGIGGVLRRKLATTNPIESCLSTVQRVARNVKRWREGNQPLRWTATGLLEAEKHFRRIKGFQELLVLKERLNPSTIQRKEARAAQVA